MRVSRLIIGFDAGVVCGIFIAQCLIVLANRSGWNFGGEALILPLIGLLLALGFTLGRDTAEIKNYEDAFEDGYLEGKADATRLNHPHNQ